MELENTILSEVSQAQKTKNRCSPSYADFTSKANCRNVVGLGQHEKRRAHLGDIEIGRKPKE
jgi:hypothetical protein